MNWKILSFFLLCLILTSCSPSQKACVNKTCFKIDVVNTFEERQLGLMHREYLDENKGMLFVFEKEDKYYFWMKNTLIPLDIIWLDNNKKIIFINKDTPPCKTEMCPSYGPNQTTKYVIEINAGLTEKYDIKEGDTFNFDY